MELGEAQEADFSRGRGSSSPLLHFPGKQTQANPQPKDQVMSYGIYDVVCQAWLFSDLSFRHELHILGKSQLHHLLNFQGVIVFRRDQYPNSAPTEVLF